MEKEEIKKIKDKIYRNKEATNRVLKLRIEKNDNIKLKYFQ